MEGLYQSKVTGLWAAYALINGKRHCVGEFEDEMLAVRVCNHCAIKLHAERAELIDAGNDVEMLTNRVRMAQQRFTNIKQKIDALLKT